MKKFFFILILFTSFSIIAQHDSFASLKKSVIALDKVNVVYRGVLNPISIAVTNCKSYEVSGLGLKKVSEGKYTISPGQGLEMKLTVTIINNDDSVSIEEHFFRIKSIPKMMVKINNQNCYDCIVKLSSDKLKEAEITIGYNDFLFHTDPDYLKVESFKVVIGKEKLKVIGDKFSAEVLQLLLKLKSGTVFRIEDITYPNPLEYCRSVPLPVEVMIVTN